MTTPLEELLRGGAPQVDPAALQGTFHGIPEGYSPVQEGKQRWQLIREYDPNSLIPLPGKPKPQPVREYWEPIGAPIENKALYTNGPGKDNWESIFLNLPAKEKIDIQIRMARAGILKTDARFGDFDSTTKTAWSKVVTHANQYGWDWNQALGDMETNPAVDITPDEDSTAKTPQQMARVRPGYVEGPYIPPDYEAIKRDVKSYLEDLLDRPVQDYELTLFADSMARDYRSSWDAQMDAQHRKFDADERMADAVFDKEWEIGPQDAEDAEGNPIKPQTVKLPGDSAGTAAPEVDPAARAKNLADKTYDAELKSNRESKEGMVGLQAMFSFADTISKMIG